MHSLGARSFRSAPCARRKPRGPRAARPWRQSLAAIAFDTNERAFNRISVVGRDDGRGNLILEIGNWKLETWVEDRMTGLTGGETGSSKLETWVSGSGRLSSGIDRPRRTDRCGSGHANPCCSVVLSYCRSSPCFMASFYSFRTVRSTADSTPLGSSSFGKKRERVADDRGGRRCRRHPGWCRSSQRL